MTFDIIEEKTTHEELSENTTTLMPDPASSAPSEALDENIGFTSSPTEAASAYSTEEMSMDPTEAQSMAYTEAMFTSTPSGAPTTTTPLPSLRPSSEGELGPRAEVTDARLEAQT